MRRSPTISWRRRSPAKFVPTVVTSGGTVITRHRCRPDARRRLDRLFRRRHRQRHSGQGGRAGVKIADGTTTIELASGQATVRGITAAIAQASTVTIANGTTTLDRLALNLGGGTATVTGTAGEALNLNATLAQCRRRSPTLSRRASVRPVRSRARSRFRVRRPIRLSPSTSTPQASNVADARRRLRCA